LRDAHPAAVTFGPLDLKDPQARSCRRTPQRLPFTSGAPMIRDTLVMSDYLSDLFSLSGKTALVAGGAGAIGSAISEAFARAGATVIIHDLSQERLDLQQAHFAAQNLPFTGIQADLSDIAGIESL